MKNKEIKVGDLVTRLGSDHILQVVDVIGITDMNTGRDIEDGYVYCVAKDRSLSHLDGEYDIANLRKWKDK